MAMSELLAENCKVKENPFYYYYAIKALEEEMEKEIYKLVIKYGKTEKTKKGIKHVLKLNRETIIACGEKNDKVEIKKLIIVGHEESQVMGHLFFETIDKKKISFGTMQYHQQFNVYSPLFRYIEDKVIKDKLISND